jgi:hypothetical protein
VVTIENSAVTEKLDVLVMPVVSFKPLVTFADHWLRNDCSEPNWCEQTDLDRNGRVNFVDFALFARDWRTPRRESSGKPVAHWTFDEGTGWIATDSVGHNDARTGGIRWTPGVLGSALSFDGVKNRAECGYAAVLAPEKLTITFWSTTDRIGVEQYVVAKAPAPNITFDPDYVVSYSTDGRMKFCFGESQEQFVRIVSEPIKQPSQWIHVAAVRDGSKALLYLNGKLVASTGYSFVPFRNDEYALAFGADSQFKCPLLGKLDDVRIYDKPLSAGEIQELYKQVSP